MSKKKRGTALKKRAPVVTIMGHVDHGKTSILDKIRDTQVQAGEAGGITQSIGAYQVDHDGFLITFIDTPGHHSFAQMRARGGRVADIVVLVVAADDGVMPQTEEALSHAQAAGAKIIVAINKVDLPSANPNKVKQQLSRRGINLVEYGGDVPAVETSAATGQGLDELLKAIQEVSGKLDLTYDPTFDGACVVIESFLDDKRGVIAHCLVVQGVVKQRDILVGGSTYARIRSLRDWQGNEIKEAVAGTPVEILGFAEVPEVGGSYTYTKKLKDAQKQIDLAKRLAQQSVEHITPQERIMQQIRDKEIKDIPIVVKAESNGSLEVLLTEIKKITTDEVRLKVIHSGVGNINENDVLLAVPVRGIVIGFGVDIERSAERIARRERIIYRLYDIIYEMIEELSDVVQGELDALTIQVLGEADVKQIFELSDKSIVAGADIKSGRVRKGNKVQVMRAGEVVGESRITSLKVLKDDVNEVTEGDECGIKLGKNFDLQIGDTIQAISE